MDIHTENKEFGETNISIEFEDNIKENQTEKPENKGIHEKFRKIYISGNRLRNNIMRSVMKSSVVSNKVKARNAVKSMICAAKKTNSSVSSSLHLLNKKKLPAAPIKSTATIPTSHSYGNFIRSEPKVTIDLEKFGKFNLSSWVGDNGCDVFGNKVFGGSLKNPSLDMRPNPMSNSLYYKPLNVHKEKPQEVNLGEIMSDVLKFVVTGEIKTVDSIIAKLRICYEEKNVFANANKKHINILHFEDDTIKPVIEIDEKYIEIINNWYESCDLILDIEKTNVSIPEIITVQDISGILFNEFSFKHKDEFLNEYLPLVINSFISNKTIKDFEKKYFTKPVKFEKSISHHLSSKFCDPNFVSIVNQSSIGEEKGIAANYSELGLKIPKNISDETFNETKNKISGHQDFFTSALDPTAIDKIKFVDPFRKIDEMSNTVQAEPEPYNIIPILPEVDAPIFEYNSEFNILNPNFSENCVNIIEKNIEQEIIKNSDLIYVILHSKYLQTLCVFNPTAEEEYIINNHPEYGFIKLFKIKTDNQEIINVIEKGYNNHQFNTIEEINEHLEIISQYIDFANKHSKNDTSISAEERQVKAYITSFYEINNNIENKMKASALYDIILNSKSVLIDQSKLGGFKNRLSKYLKDLGLEKKRFNDGYYYYGIKVKNNGYAEVSTEPLVDCVSKRIKQRMEEEARFIGLERLKMFSVAEEAGVEPEVVCEKDVVKGAKKKTQKKK
jgi:hypothetical protein